LEETKVSPVLRVSSGQEASKQQIASSKWIEASKALKQCVTLPQTLCVRSHNREDQQSKMALFSDIAALACSCALQADENPADALGVLELGRGVIVGSLIDTRDEIAEFQEEYPEIAGKLAPKQKELNAITTNLPLRKHSLNAVDVNWLTPWSPLRDSIKEFEDLQKKIRTLDKKFKYFQLQQPSYTFPALVSEGPIVFLMLRK
jgi:hypothetical protein